jgi:hypothetical protein
MTKYIKAGRDAVAIRRYRQRQPDSNEIKVHYFEKTL